MLCIENFFFIVECILYLTSVGSFWDSGRTLFVLDSYVCILCSDRVYMYIY